MNFNDQMHETGTMPTMLDSARVCRLLGSYEEDIIKAFGRDVAMQTRKWQLETHGIKAKWRESRND